MDMSLNNLNPTNFNGLKCKLLHRFYHLRSDLLRNKDNNHFLAMQIFVNYLYSIYYCLNAYCSGSIAFVSDDWGGKIGTITPFRRNEL